MTDVLAQKRSYWKYSPGWIHQMPRFDWPLSEPFWAENYEKVMTAKEVHEALMRGDDPEETYSITEYCALIEEIRVNGLKTPVSFGSTGPWGDFHDLMTLWDGHHRIGSYYALGMKYIPHILRG